VTHTEIAAGQVALLEARAIQHGVTIASPNWQQARTRNLSSCQFCAESLPVQSLPVPLDTPVLARSILEIEMGSRRFRTASRTYSVLAPRPHAAGGVAYCSA
jgi:hypothetical protein